MPTVLMETELVRLDAYWRAANYLSVGQIYLLDNPLLREPLRLAHIKAGEILTTTRRWRFPCAWSSGHHRKPSAPTCGMPPP
jgi:phosphoketolase